MKIPALIGCLVTTACLVLVIARLCAAAESATAPEVITTVTDEKTQQEKQQRPTYLQPTKIAGEAPATTLPLELQENETLVFLGNSLAERMEHHNYFETLLQKQFAGRNVTFRNMGFPGHTAAFRPEAGNDDPWAFPGGEKFHPEIREHLGIGHYPKPDEWLTIVQASTIVAFFGFNESFAGPEELENFKNELRAFVDHTLSRSYRQNGQQPPRLVLATPIATEDLPQYALPDAGRRNQTLQQYAQAVLEVAQEKKVGAIDLYTPTAAWFAASDAPLTINGIHLSAEGYKNLAPLLMEKLYGESPSLSTADDLLCAAIADKAWFWRNDYRMLNGVHAYGRRWAPYGNFNYPEEIEKIRQMTVLRDRNVWAIAEGKSSTLDVDDSVTRPLSPVETNYAASEKNGSLDYLKVEQDILDKFELPEGYQVSLFASEQQFPNLGNPCQMRFDNQGRLWVSTLISYPHYQPGDPKPNDMILIYEDTDQDGRADKETVFAQGLHMPIGFELAPEGVYLSQEPFLLLLKDTDGDDHADKTEYLLDGFDPHDTHHAISAFDVDNGAGIFMCEGRFLHSQVETPWGPQRMTDGGAWRFDPHSWKLERVFQSDVSNPWGVAHDEYGQNFLNDASGGNQYWMLGNSVKMPHSLEIEKVSKFNYEHHTRPTSGSEFIYSRHFPDEVQGDYIYCNTIGFLGIKDYKTVEDGSEIKGQFRQNLIQSTDGNFRPCDLEIAPDGSLYFVDWHNTLIGHMQHSARDPLRNSEYGRIYRITYPSRPLVEPPQIAGAEIATLFENFKLPELNARKRSHRELRGRDKEEVITAAVKFAAANAGDERLVLEALWATWGQQAPSEPLLQASLSAKDHRVRSAAVRVVRHCLHLLADPKPYLLAAAQDPHPRVRLEALSAASWLGGSDGAEILLTVASQPTDRWIRNSLNAAILSLKPAAESLLATGAVHDQDLTVDVDKLFAGELPGALKPQNFRTKSKKFADKQFKQQYDLGQRVFLEEGSCHTCHREHGEGVPRIYPPLAGSEWANGDPERLVKLTLHGVWGKIQVKGKLYEPGGGVPPMTAIGNMFTDAEITAVLNYVRTSWGNDAPLIQQADVERIRQETSDRRKFYSPEELLEMHPFAPGSQPPLVEDATTPSVLEQELRAESLSQLVADTWKSGDAVRGAKLFYNEKIACATCHDVDHGYQLGPQLTSARMEATEQHLLKSILNPSADILEGYKSATVLLVDGVAVSGFLINEDEKAITLRVPADAGRTREIPQDDVDEVLILKNSTMPEGIANQLENRQAFLDLGRFVLEINKGGKRRLKELRTKAGK